MSKVVYLESDPALQEQAGMWIARMDRGLSDQERAELRRWLSQSARHRSALFDMASAWDQLDILAEIADLFPIQRRALRLAHTWRIAAALAVVAVAIGLTVRSTGLFGRDSLVATYQTVIGEQKSVPLPDNSRVTLNTDTLLRVNYTHAERRLELLKGEAHFKVAKDSLRVFTVKAGDNEFKAVGTAFNIRMVSARGMELTVTEGRVKVIVPFSTAVGPSEDPSTRVVPTEIVVDAGKEVVVDQAIQTIEPLAPVKLEAALAWQNGMLVFDGEPLEQVVQELSRYSTTRFVIVDDSIKQTPVTGYFKIGDVNGLIAALHANFDIDVTKNGTSIFLDAK